MSALIVLVPAVLVLLGAFACAISVGLRSGSRQLVEARRRQQPLAHELPYWHFFDEAGLGIAVNVDLAYSAFLELRGVDVDCLDDDRLVLLGEGLHSVLQNLPTATTLQFLHWTDGDVREQVTGYVEAARGSSPFGRRLVESKAKHLLRSSLRRSRLVLAVTIHRAQAADGPFRFVRKFPRFARSEHAATVQQLATLTGQVVHGLAALTPRGVACQPLDERTVRTLVYQFLNAGRAEIVPAPFAGVASPSPAARVVPPELSSREQLALTAIEERRDRLVAGGKVHRVLTLRCLPTFTTSALLESLLVGLSGVHFRTSFAVEILDTQRALGALKRTRDQAHLMSAHQARRNQEAEAQEDDVLELIDKNLRANIRMVQVVLAVVLTVDAGASAGALLDKQTADVIHLVSALNGAQLVVDEMNQLDEFLATLPGNARASRRWSRCTSENAAHLMPVWQSFRGDRRPLVPVQNGRSELVGLDPFDSERPNANAFMAGSSGSGKSSTTNYLLLNLLAAGTRAIVVDVGGSYRRVIHLFGGQYFAVQVEGSEPCCLNLFFKHAEALLPDGKLDENRLAFMLAVVERMVVHRQRPELRNVDRAVLGRAIHETYRRVSTRTPILQDLVATLRDIRFEDEEDVELARGLARSLRVWIEGPAARLLNGQTTVELTTGCAAFDLKGLEAHGELQAVVMVILSGIIWNVVMRDNTTPKVVVFDEVWRFFESPASAKLVAELYRTARKYCASVLTISQAVEDFTSSSIAAALINNSATVYLLKHQSGHELVAEQFHLNARERDVFRGLEMRRGEFTEVLALHGEHHFLARIVLTPLEYWMATTHPADLAIERELRARDPHLSLQQLLWKLARRYPRGAGSAPRALLRSTEDSHA